METFHFRKRHLGHGGCGGQGRAANGGKGATAAYGGQRKPAPAVTEPSVAGIKQGFREPRVGSKIAHQNEQRHDRQVVVDRRLVGGLAQKRQGGIEIDQEGAAEKSGKGHCKTDRPADRQQREQQKKYQYREGDRIHGVQLAVRLRCTAAGIGGLARRRRAHRGNKVEQQRGNHEDAGERHDKGDRPNRNFPNLGDVVIFDARRRLQEQAPANHHHEGEGDDMCYDAQGGLKAG